MTTKWVTHTPMSEPLQHAAALRRLPCEPRQLNAIIQGLMVHFDLAQTYGIESDRGSRATLSVAHRLTDILSADSQAFEMARPPQRRVVGTCRDFALLLTSCLRTNGVPARVRCGFAAYFGAGWADHWVCEYWDRTTETWQLSDPQIDEIQREDFGIAFDSARVPRESFLDAGRAWSACRTGRFDANLFGHGNATGLWFLGVNVVRDHLALNGHETSAWDLWREVPQQTRVIQDVDLALLDELAVDPAGRLVGIAPFWS